MKKRFLFIVCIVSLIVSCQQKKSNEIEIGAIVPLTGYSAINGVKFMQGMELAIDEINNEEIPFSMKVIFEDSKSTGKDAHSAYRKLSGSSIKYFAAFGGQFVLGFAEETNNTDKLMFASATPNINLLSLTNRCLRIYPTIEMTAEKVKQEIIKQGSKRVAIIHTQNEAYSMYAEIVLKKLKECGIPVILVEAYDPYCQDFKNIVNKIAQNNIDFIYSSGLGESSALLTKQLYANPKTMNIPVIGDMNYLNPENLEIIGEIKSTIYAVDSYIDSTFASRFNKKYHQQPNALSAYGYAIPYLLKEALLFTGNNASTDEVYDYIKSHEFQTAAGTISFDSITREPNLTLITRAILPSSKQ